MNVVTYNKLFKIASEVLPTPVGEHVLDVLGYTESGYNPYDSTANLNDYYIRTKIRGTWGDPTIPRAEWTSSTAWNPWQSTEARSIDIAKLNSAYGKLFNSKLANMYNEMKRTGLGSYWYKQYLDRGLLPQGFIGKYRKSHDYGGRPFDVTAEEHQIIRGGMLDYINQRMLPKTKGLDPEKQWKMLAAIHHIGHATPLNEKERKKLDAYWSMLRPKIQEMAKHRETWKINNLNKQRAELFKGIDPASKEYASKLSAFNKYYKDKLKTY